MNIKMKREGKNKGRYIELLFFMIVLLFAFPITVSAGATGTMGSGGKGQENGVVATIKNYNNQVTGQREKRTRTIEKRTYVLAQMSRFRLFFYVYLLEPFTY